MARSLTRELGSRSITANVVAPGFIDTEMTQAMEPGYVEMAQQAIPLGRGRQRRGGRRSGQLPGVRGRRSYVSGAVIPVDGGMGMGH